MVMESVVGNVAALKPIWDRLDKIERLGHNWDSYGARPPAPAAVHSLRQLIEAAYWQLEGAANAVPYTVAPLVDGGMQAEWRGPGGALEVEVSPARTLGYLLVTQRDGTEHTTEGDRVSWNDMLRIITAVIASPASPAS